MTRLAAATLGVMVAPLVVTRQAGVSPHSRPGVTNMTAAAGLVLGHGMGAALALGLVARGAGGRSEAVRLMARAAALVLIDHAGDRLDLPGVAAAAAARRPGCAVSRMAARAAMCRALHRLRLAGVAAAATRPRSLAVGAVTLLARPTVGGPRLPGCGGRGLLRVAAAAGRLGLDGGAVGTVARTAASMGLVEPADLQVGVAGSAVPGGSHRRAMGAMTIVALALVRCAP